MEQNLSLTTANIDFVRNQPKWVGFQPKDANGNVIDCSLVTHAKMIIGFAMTNDTKDQLRVYDSGFTFLTDRIDKRWDFDMINDLPLGSFLYEMLISDDGFWFYTVYQGTVNVFPSMYNQPT